MNTTISFERRSGEVARYTFETPEGDDRKWIARAAFIRFRRDHGLAALFDGTRVRIE